MSLTDLKKKIGAKKKEAVSVDDFISEAELYAKGKDTEKKKRKTKSKRKRHFKNATFTLSPGHIAQLDDISKDSGVSKSQILRLLISELADDNELTLEALLEHIKNRK